MILAIQERFEHMLCSNELEHSHYRELFLDAIHDGLPLLKKTLVWNTSNHSLILMGCPFLFNDELFNQNLHHYDIIQ